MTTYFVTGATGFLGSHVARVLAEQGADIRLLVRPTSNLKNLEGLKAETAIGDLRDAASLRKAMSRCDTVFHVAADYRLWLRDPQEMYRSNVEGTRNILEAARNNGVRAVLYTSSVATMHFANCSVFSTIGVPNAGRRLGWQFRLPAAWPNDTGLA